MTDIAPAPAPTPDNPPPAPAPTPAPSAPPPNGAPPPASDGKPVDPPKTDWRQDWATKDGKVDDKELKRLQRFPTQADVYKSFREMEAKLSSGELKRDVPFPVDGKPEDQAAWRKDRGIPETPDKYDLKFDDGLTIGDEDKPYVEKYLQRMHANHRDPGAVKDAIAAYYDIREQQQKELVERDGSDRETAEESLRLDWGPDFKANKTALGVFVNRLPESVRDIFLNARGGDGKALLNNPAIIKSLVAVERDVNPMATVAPNASNPGAAVSSELDEIRKLMRDDHSEYWKGPKDANGRTAKERRFLELTEATIRAQARGAAR